MPYATQQDMQDRYGLPKLVQLTDINEPMTGAVVGAVLDSKLADASAEIDGYLAGRMSVPLADPPAVVKVYCCRIAYYLLLGAAADELARMDYKGAIDYFRRVATGDITMTPPDAAPAQAGLGSVSFDPGTKVMGRDAEFGGDTSSWSRCL